MEIFERGFNYSQDGPGNRLVYHLQGCNMRCKWCSNPEGMKAQAPIMAVKSGIPEVYCDKGAIRKGILDRQVCSTCQSFFCLNEKNPKIYKKVASMTVQEVFEDIMQAKMMFFNGGGVTFTGGEVLLQFEEVRRLCDLLHKEGIHTAIETNASLPVLQDLLEFVDFFMIDIKHYNEEQHQKYTGISLMPVLENVKGVINARKQVLLRIPLINGVNADNVDGFIERLNDLKSENLLIELLRYHEYGKEKWAMCGYEYTIENGHISQETYDVYKKAFLNNGFNLITT